MPPRIITETFEEAVEKDIKYEQYADKVIKAMIFITAVGLLIKFLL